MILLDTSVLIDGLTGPRRSAPALRAAIAAGERPALAAIVLYEWLHGPRLPGEVAAQEALMPAERALPFGPEQAALAAHLHGTVRRPRGREIDLAIAATAISNDAKLWTLNPADFADVPGLELYRPRP